MIAMAQLRTDFFHNVSYLYMMQPSRLGHANRIPMIECGLTLSSVERVESFGATPSKQASIDSKVFQFLDFIGTVNALQPFHR